MTVHKINNVFLKKSNLARLPVFLTLLLAAVSCKDSVQVSEMTMPIRLNLLAFDGRPLESGTEAGLFASSPVSIDNVMCVIATDGTAQSEKELNWALGQTDTFPVLAYSPYDPSFVGMSIVNWPFPKDQSTAQSYANANLMSGIGTGKPAMDLNIRLEHEMTSLQFRIENRLAGDSIANVFAYGFSCDCTFNLYNGELSAGGDVTTITAFRPHKDVDFFCLLYPPQAASPFFLIEMKSGRKFYMGVQADIPVLKGGIVGITGMQIDAGTPEASYSETAMVNITQWTNAGLPELLGFSNELSLSQLDSVKTDGSSYFVSCIGPATVTHVESWGENGCMAILEDGSAAKKIYALCKETYLPKGSIARGIIDGYRTMTDDGPLYHYINLSQASVMKGGTLPLTEGSVGSLADSIGQLRYRRMMFHNVEVESDIEGDVGLIVQNGTPVKLLVPGNDTRLRAGSRGNLTAYPDIAGGEVVLVAYDHSSLDSLALPVVETCFTADSVCGVYSVDKDGNAVPVLSEAWNSLCVSTGKYADAVMTQFLDLDSGKLTVLVLTLGNSPVVGHDYMLSSYGTGQSDDGVTYRCLRCMKQTQGMVWLLDEENMTGYILRI